MYLRSTNSYIQSNTSNVHNPNFFLGRQIRIQRGAHENKLEVLQHSVGWGLLLEQELIIGTERAHLETCSQRGPLGLISLKASSIWDLVLIKATVSSGDHRLPVEFRSPSLPLCSLNSSGTGPVRACSIGLDWVEGPGFSGKVEIWSMSFDSRETVGWR